MVKIDSTTEKLLERPIAKEIMSLLVDNDLSIPQLAKKMKNSSIQTIVAYLAELQRFGLIELTDPTLKNTEETEQKGSHIFPSTEILNPKRTQFPPLGMSILEYNKLWEKVSRNNSKINLQELSNSTFTVPSSLKHTFKPEKHRDI